MKSIVIISSQAFSLINFRGQLIGDLVRAGIKVFALAPDYDASLREQVVKLGAEPIDFRISRTGMNPFHDICDTFRLASLLRKLRPEVMLGYFIKPVIFGTLAAWMARVPRRIAMIEGLGYVFTPAGVSLPLHRQVLRTVVSLLYRFSLSRARRVIFLNRDDIDEFVQRDIVNRSKIVHLKGIGVDLNKWVFVPPVCAPVTFILVARLLREKGVHEYVAAARRIKADDASVRFVLLGGLDLNPGGLAESEVRAWVDEGLLEWPGHVDVAPWMAQASVFVLPSYREGLPRSTQEAMAMGRAVITTDVPGCRETVVDGVNGFLVPARDENALAQAMRKFVKDPSLIASMGRESYQMAVDRFDVHVINRQLIEVLDTA